MPHTTLIIMTSIARVQTLALLAATITLAAVGASLEQGLELWLVHYLGSCGWRLVLWLLLALGQAVSLGELGLIGLGQLEDAGGQLRLVIKVCTGHGGQITGATRYTARIPKGNITGDIA